MTLKEAHYNFTSGRWTRRIVGVIIVSIVRNSLFFVVVLTYVLTGMWVAGSTRNAVPRAPSHRAFAEQSRTTNVISVPAWTAHRYINPERIIVISDNEAVHVGDEAVYVCEGKSFGQLKSGLRPIVETHVPFRPRDPPRA